MTERNVVTVTGASGHLGGAVVRELVRRGRRVRAVVAEPPGTPLPSVEGHEEVDVVRADVRDPEQVRAAIDGSEEVIHLAARISVVRWDRRAVHAVNVGGTEHVVEASLATGVRRLVHVSTVDAASSTSPYAVSKALGERAALDAVGRGLDVVVVRPTGIVGPGDHGTSLIGRTLLDAWSGRLPAVVDGGYDWVDVRDVADAVVTALTAGWSGGSYTLAGTWVTMADLVGRAVALQGRRPPRVVPMGVARAAAVAVEGWSHVTRRQPRLSRAALAALAHAPDTSTVLPAAHLAHAPRPLDITLADTLAWFESVGALHRPATLAAVGAPA